MTEWQMMKNKTTMMAATKNHRHEHLLVGWERVPLQNGNTTTRPNTMT
jgi:hypothetical protein